MKRVTLLIIALLCVVSEWIASCSQSQSDSTAIPRRKAYPRVSLYDSSYVAIPDFPITLTINTSTSARIDRKKDGACWINIDYFRYGATVRGTLQRLSGEKLKEAIANRNERFSLDISGNQTEVTELTSPAEVSTTIMLTPSASVTPIHMLSTDNRSFLFSAIVEFKNPDIEANVPAVKAIYDDLILAAKQMAAVTGE